MIYALFAAAVTTACAAAPAVQAWRLSRYERPSVAELLERIRTTKSGERREDWMWELTELMIEVDAKTRAPAEFSLALARASIACGTACAVLRLASAPELAHLPEAGMAFGAGVVGAAVASYFGRLAKSHSAAARSHWSGLARDVCGALERELPLEPAGR